MSKYISILLLLFVSKSYCQIYEPLVDTTKMWVVFYGPAANPLIGYTKAYCIKDSVYITDKYWYKVLESSDSAYSNWTLNGYIIEKDKIVLYKNKDYLNETDTLYDFNKQLNDKVYINAYINYDISSVTQINFAGKIRTKYETNGFCEGLEYYEGIGDINGPLEPHLYCIVGIYRTLVCYYKNNDLLYLNPKYNNCYLNNLPNNINSIEQSKIYLTNSNLLKVELNNYSQLKNVKILIFNALGQKIDEYELRDELNTINLSMYNGDILFYKIKVLNNIVKNGILILK